VGVAESYSANLQRLCKGDSTLETPTKTIVNEQHPNNSDINDSDINNKHASQNSSYPTRAGRAQCDGKYDLSDRPTHD
jgi:hypothetical protein